MKIILLGPPGSGKGTQGELLAKYLNIPKITPGDIYRDEIKRQTTIGKLAESKINNGEYMPDDITNQIIQDKILDCKKGYILDGYPRTIAQAEFLDSYDTIDFVINVDVNDNAIITRMSGRRTCPKCKETYHLEFKKPKVNGICDNDQEKLIIREDQKPEVIKTRLKIYTEKTKELIDFYKHKKLLVTVNGQKQINEIFEDIKTIIQ